MPCASKRAGLVLASGINARFTQLNNTIIPTVIKHTAAPGIYKIVGTLPVESEGRLTYRIKSAVETFERTADESGRPQHQ